MSGNLLAAGIFILLLAFLSNKGFLIPLIIAIFGIVIIGYIIKFIYDVYKQKEIRKQQEEKCQNLLNTVKLLKLNNSEYIKFNGSYFNDNKDLVWNEITDIKLMGHHINKETIFTGITKLDGTPDWRYRHDKSEWVDKYSTKFEIYFYTGKKRVDIAYFKKEQKVSKNSIESKLKKYNIFIQKLKKKNIAEAYQKLFDINDSCKINKSVLVSIEIKIKELEKSLNSSVDSRDEVAYLKELRGKVTNLADKYKVEESQFIKLYNGNY